MNSYYKADEGGNMHMLAYVVDAEKDIVSVEILFNMKPTGVKLRKYGNQGLYQLIIPNIDPAPEIQDMDLLMELSSLDAAGNIGLWPYLYIYP